MKIKKHNDISGTCLRGYIKASYDELVKAFGEPHYTCSDTDEKVSCEWGFNINGTIATIYDWKTYSGIPKGYYDWHIGGLTHDAVVAVNSAFKKIN